MTITIYTRRWFDKVNGNSYFNYYIVANKGKIIPALYDLEYGYGNQPFQTAKEHLKKLRYKIQSHKIIEVDLGYGLQRDMKNMNK